MVSSIAIISCMTLDAESDIVAPSTPPLNWVSSFPPKLDTQELSEIFPKKNKKCEVRLR